MPRSNSFSTVSFLTASLKTRSRISLVAIAFTMVTMVLTLGGWHLISSRAASGTAVSLTTLGTPYTQNFDTLSNTAGSTTNVLSIPGWGLTETGGGTRDNEQYAVDTGGSNSGDTYSYGTAAATDRALGGLRSGTLLPVFGACFTNNTGATVTSLQVAYTGEEWRLGTAARTDQISFEYSTNATDFVIGTWTAVAALNFVTPVTATTGAKDGNVAANRTALSTTITGLTIANGATFFIRWTDIDATGADDGLAVDDFSITPQGTVTVPILTITAPDASASETGPDAGTFRITRTGATTSALSISYSIAGTSTASPGDYNPALTGTTTIPIGSAFVNLTITPVDDMLVEASETVILNLTDTVDYDLGSPATATITISDNDSPPTLSINDVSITEGNAGTSLLTFTVMSSSPSPAGGFDGFLFNFTTMNGTATTADNDYVGVVNQFASISPGNSSTTVSVTINGDTTVETNETFSVVLAKEDPMDLAFNFSDDTGVGTINNDDVAITPIHDIQGSGTISPLSGSVITEGIVTALRTNGFYLQAPEGEYDANPATSEGIFVFGSPVSASAVVGNRLRVTGTITEFIPTGEICSNVLLRPNCLPEISTTQLTGPTIVQLSTGNTLPAAVTLLQPSPGGGITQLEPFEFMRVKIAALTVVAPTGGFKNEAAATSTSDGVFQGIITPVISRLFDIPNRPYREAGIEAPEPVPPGSGAMIPPVPRFDGNPERIRVDSDALGQPVIDVTTGATVANLQGVLDYAFRTYTLFPDGTATPTVSGNVTALPLPDPDANQFRVGSFNIERFYDDVNDPGGDTVLTLTALNNRLNKASLAIRNILRSPDILGIVEAEKLSVLQLLANKINADAVAAGQPNPGYAAFLVEGNDPGGIDVGFLIKTAIVTGTTPRVSVTEVLQEGAATTFIDPTDMSVDTLHDRPPLRLTGFVNNADGRSFPITVIVNHLRSLNGNNDPVDGTRVRFKRQKQAEFLANLVQTRQTNNPNERIALVGDFNAFKVNDGYANLMDVIRGVPTPDNQDVVPSGADLVNPDLVNLVNDYPGSASYTYVFGGNAQPLDHVLVNGKLNDFFAQFYVAHLDADFPEIYRTDANRPERISDHDAPVAAFNFDPLPDISLTKTHTGDFTVGMTGQYNFLVTNDALAGATLGAVTLTDNLPATLTLNSFSGTGWTCTGTGTANVSCTNATILNPGDSLPVLTITVNVGAGTPVGPNSITNIASVRTPREEEPNFIDNEARDKTTILAVVCPTITLTPASVPAGVVGTAYLTQNFSAAGGTGPYSFVLTGTLPMGMTFSGGALSGTPMQAGTFSFTVTATEAMTNCTGAQMYSLSVTCPTITVTPTTLPNATVGTAYTGTLMASGGTASYTFSTVSALPMGLTLNSNGTITGIPMAATTVNINVIATDSKGCTGSAAVSFSIVCPTITVTPTTLPNATAGVTYTGTLSANGGNASYTFALASGSSLPAGLTLNSNGTITGTPTTVGAVNVNVVATDSKGCTGSAAVGFSIVCPTIMVNVPATNTGIVTAPFSQTFTQTGGVGTTTFSTASALPTGLTLSAAGVLSGTPIQLGSFPLTVKATDNNNCMGTASYTLTISKANTTTVVVSSLSPSLINQAVTFTVTVAPVAPATGTPTGTVQFKIDGVAFGAPVALTVPPAPAAGGAIALALLADSTASVTTATLSLGAHTITAEYSSDALFNGSIGSMTQNVIANPNVDPVPSDQKPGSVLFYNYFTSTVDAARQNTRINITNTHVTQSAYVHLFFVDGSNCSVADSYICLTPNQTASFLASDLDPGTTGYIVAVATDRTGCPIDFNFLIGDEYVKLSSGHQANLGAEAISAVAGGLPACDASSSNVELRFNGTSYNALPRTLALSSFGSPADGNNTLLIVNRVGGNLATGAASIGSLFGLLYDDTEKAYSFALSGSSCQLRGSLSGTFPRTTPRIESIVSSGRSGWMRLSSSIDGGIFGATINFNGNAAANAGAFNQGHNLHKLTLTTAASYTIPVFPPTC